MTVGETGLLHDAVIDAGVPIPAEEVQKEKERIAREYARKLSIPGFRKGRAPASVVRSRFQKERKPLGVRGVCFT